MLLEFLNDCIDVGLNLSDCIVEPLLSVLCKYFYLRMNR